MMIMRVEFVYDYYTVKDLLLSTLQENFKTYKIVCLKSVDYCHMYFNIEFLC